MSNICKVCPVWELLRSSPEEYRPGLADGSCLEVIRALYGGMLAKGSVGGLGPEKLGDLGDSADPSSHAAYALAHLGLVEAVGACAEKIKLDLCVTDAR